MNKPTAFDRAKEGITLAGAIEQAMQAVANTRKVAKVDANGDVKIDRDMIFLLAFASTNVTKQMEKVFDLFWEATRDKAVHHHRAKWSRERKRGIQDLAELEVNIDPKAVEVQ